MAKELRFADWLIATGRAMGYTTYTSLAQALGVPQPTVSRWKAGAKPSVEHLVRISELFGIELKTLLILSGHMKGDVSAKDLALPSSQADRIIASMKSNGEYREMLKDFWQRRQHEELERLQLLADGVDATVTTTGRADPKSMEPWLEGALRSELSKHLRALEQELSQSPGPITWMVRSFNPDRPDPLLLFHEDVKKGAKVDAGVYEEEGLYVPFVRAPGSWQARTHGFVDPEIAAVAVEVFLSNNPGLDANLIEEVMSDAPEEEGPR